MQKHILFNIQSLKNIDLFIGYLAAIQGMSFVACGIQFSDQRLNPDPLQWEHGVLAARLPPGKSPSPLFQISFPFRSSQSTEQSSCAVEQVLLSYLSYTQQHIYVSPNLPIHSTLLPFFYISSFQHPGSKELI